MFLIPLSWWSDRSCTIAGVDPLYHTVLWLHERLAIFVVLLAVISVCVVAAKITVARLRFNRLSAVSEPLPSDLRRSFESASQILGTTMPSIMYLDVAAPIATTVVGPVVVISSGFLAPLATEEVDLVVRHEMVHASRRDALTGVVWHLGFAALLIPGFEAIERHLHRRRERRASLLAAHGDEERYLALIGRFSRGTNLCANAELGLEPRQPRPNERWLTWVAPLIVLFLAIGLTLSHHVFETNKAYLVSHHC